MDQRQRSQGLDCDERATALGAGLPRAHPFLGAAIGLALQANQAVYARGPAALGGRRTVAAQRADALDDLVHGGAVFDGCGSGVLDCARQRLVR